MKESINFFFVKRFLRGKNKKILIPKQLRGGIIGVALSLIPLILVIVIADSMIAGITNRFLEAGTYHLQAMYRGADENYDDTRIDELRAVEGVKHIFQEIQGTGLISSEQDSAGVSLRALDPSLYAEDEGFRNYLRVEEGEFILEGRNDIVVGKALAKRLSLEIGDEIKILTVRTMDTDRFLPRISRFTVKGIISTGYQDLDGLWAFISLERGQRILPSENRREILGIKIDNPYGIENPLIHYGEKFDMAKVNEILGLEWRIYNWFELERSQYMSFVSTRNILIVIMLLIVFVATVNVASAMMMLVLERNDEIGLLRSIGASPGLILQVFTLLGGLTGLIGTVMGLGVGVLLALLVNQLIQLLEVIINALSWLFSSIAGLFDPVYFSPIEIFNEEFYLSEIPVKINADSIILIGVLSLGLSFLASFLPALKASRLKPLEVLRRS